MSAADVPQPPHAQAHSRPRRALQLFWRLATDRAFRNYKWVSYFPPKGAFQLHKTTQPDRYPDIFEFLRAQLGAESEIRILSFGCSSGEEVFSLRQYFPRATIKGIDINPRNIAQCKKQLRRKPDAAISFVTANSTAQEAAASYDLICCMAVLRCGGLERPDVTRCDHRIRLADFSAVVDDFCRCLKPGGLLAIRHSNFRVSDAPTGHCFQTILRIAYMHKVNIFDPGNRPLPDVDYPDTVFRKVAA